MPFLIRVSGSRHRQSALWFSPNRTLMLCAAVLAALAAQPGAAAAQTQDQDCVYCHGDLEFLRQHATSLDDARRMEVTGERILASAHFESTCSDCHQGFGAWPHPENGTTESCASCHEEQDSAWHGSLHAEPVTEGEEPAECADCHSLHDVVTLEELHEGPGMLAMNTACVQCHEGSALPEWDAHADTVACGSCHLPHESPGVNTLEAGVAPLAQAAVCGECHEEPGETALRDAHGGGLREMDPMTLEELAALGEEAPATCTSCHGAHGMRAIEDPLATGDIQNQCSSCHADYSERYYGTYHGKATALGSEIVASCADCHSAHEIYAASEAESWVHADRLVETCADCHEQSRPAFVLYDSHPDPMDRSRNAPLFFSFVFMNTLLIGVLIVFGLHTLLWWVRIIIDQRRERQEAGHA